MEGEPKSLVHLDMDPEENIGRELPDPWDQPGLWEDPREVEVKD